MSKPTKTAFELEAMIAAEMLLLGDCPFGLKLAVLGDGDHWEARAETDDAKVMRDVATIAADMQVRYGLEA